MAVWKQQRSSTINMICGQVNCYSNCHIDYDSNIPHDLNGFFEWLCDKCNHSLWDHHRCHAKWEQVRNTQTPVDQEMKKWETAKNGTEKTAILVAVSEKVLHDLDQIISGAINSLEEGVGRYTCLSLSGFFSAQVGSAVKLLEQKYIVLEEKCINKDHLQRVEESFNCMKRKLDLVNAYKEQTREQRIEIGYRG